MQNKNFQKLETLKKTYKNLSKSFNAFFKFFICFIILFSFFSEAIAQVVIPRDGFPYCEPFTNSTFRQNTILGGSPVIPTLTAATLEDPEGDGFLRLTSNNTDHRGYVFVDLPFSSAYGLKFSFEYFMYGGTGADGISVFLFDGSISAAQFQIGGWGGSLGYAPINAQDIIPSPIVLPGLKGGYLGLGLDAFKNWGNNMEGRFGGFDDPNAPPINLSFTATKDYFQSIAVRGPESSNYKFIAGKRVLHGPENEPNPLAVLPPASYLYPNVADINRRFSLASPVKVVNCNLDGYRKVFVNLRPTGTGTYLLSVDLLVTENGSRRIEPIIINEPYNFVAPPNLKIGFAASTGGDTNFHEIRNVTVEVSDYISIPIPQIEDQSAEVCVGDDNLFEFEVDLKSENSFIRCVQLYTTDPGVPDNSPPTGGDPAGDNCYLSGACIEKCDPANNSVIIPGKGTFTVILDENVDLQNEDDRIKAAINFVPIAGFVGEAQVFYQVIDNYGLTSFAKTVTVISNPYPVELSEGDIEFPTCDGQSNGLIFDVEVGDLVGGFDYEWFWQPTTGPEVSLGKVGASVNFDAGTGVAIFSVDNINLGVYTLQVWNPSDGGGCYLSIPIDVNQELGTPVDLTSEEEIICEFQPVSFTPFINGVPPSLQADFKWYQNADRSGPLINNTTVSIGGSPVQVEVNQGILTLTGLQANGASTRTYEFFVEVAPQVNPGAPNFCPFLGNVTTSATVIVHPGIDLTTTTIPDWCRDGIGAVNVNADGGNGPKTFVLLDESGQNILFQNSTGQFQGLLPGTYQVEVSSQAPNCIETVEVIVEGPGIDLAIVEISRTSPSCELDNGEFSFQLSGGNGPYNIGSITLQGGSSANLAYDNATDSYTVGGLAPNTNYTVEFLDARSCLIDLSFTLDEISKPVFAVNIPAPICESDASYFLDVSYDFFEIQNTAVPVFNWYQQETGGSPISNGPGPGGLNYNYDSQSGDLLISNLVGGTYTLYLELSGPDACNLPRQRVDFEIFEIPIVQISSFENISCFAGDDGSITVTVTNGNISNFEFKIDGVTDFQSQPVFNTGLQAGTYTIIAQNVNTGCQNTISITLEEPTALVISNLGTENSFCGLDNGIVSFEITGGTPAYTLSLDGNPVTGIDLNSSGANVEIADLTPGDHQLILTDAKGCELIQNFTITADPFAEFSAIGAIICEIDPNSGTPNTAILSPEIIEIASSTPVFQWYYLNGSGIEVAVNSGDVVFGGTSSIDSDGKLYLTGIEASASAYIFLLDITGDKVCTEPKRQVELIVNPLPNPEFTTKLPSCFSGGDGEISVSNGHSSDYTYELIATGESNSSGTFSSLTAGNYTIRVTNSITSCFELFDVELDQPEVLEMINTDFDNPTCGESNGKLFFEIIGGTPDYQIKLNGNLLSTYTSVQTGQSFEVSDLAPADYDIEITDANGCTLTLLDAFILVDDQGAPINMTPIDAEFCFNEPAILTPEFNPTLPVGTELKWYRDQTLGDEIISSPNPDPSGVVFQIDGLGNLTVENLPVGQHIYYLEITGPEVCSKIEEVNLQIFSEIVATFDFENVSCFGGNDGSIELTSVDPAGTITYTLVETGDTNTTGIFDNLSVGDYTIRAQETDSPCTYDFSVSITQPDQLVISNPLGTNPTCGDSNGSIQFDLNGGTPEYVILVNGNPLSGYAASINGATVELKNLPPGIYSVAVTDANGCVVTAPNLLTLINDDGVVVDMNPLDEVICVGGDAVLLPTYSIALPVVPTLKWYKDASLTQSITNGTDANGVVYQINPANGELRIQGLQVGDFKYYVEISGPGICSRVESATLEVIPEITATIATQDIICFGDTNGSINITPSGGNGVFEISLNGSPFTNLTSYSDLAAGSYTVSIRNDVGCLTEIDVEILGPIEVIGINSPTIIRASCGEDNGSIGDLVISGGWGDYNVEWRKGSVTGPVVPGGLTGAEDLAPATYFLLITDSEGCAAEFSFVVGQSSDPIYAVVPPINGCTGNPVEIRPIHLAPDPSLPPAAATEVRWYAGPGQTALIQNGPHPTLPGVTYTIDDSDWLNPELQIDGLPAGTYEFYFFVVCTGQEIEIKVIVFDTPEVALEIDPVVCFGDTNGKVSVSSGSNPIYTYSLNGGTPTNLTALESQNLAAGSYNLVIATPAGCAQNLNFVVEGPAAPLASSPLTKIDPGCGALNGKLILTISGGWAPYTLEVFKNGVSANIVTTTDTEITLDGYAVGDYRIEIRDAEGCVIVTNVVTLEDGPTQIVIADKAICEGESATLIPILDPVAPGSSFQWYLDQGLSQPITSSPNPAGDGRIYQINASTGALTVSGLPESAIAYSYYVTASGAAICPGFIGQGEIKVGSTPTARASVLKEVCFGDGATITVNASGGSGNYTYSLNGGAFVNTNVFDVDPGTYSIEVKTQEGCSFTLNDIIAEGPQEALSFNSLDQDAATCGLDNGEIRFVIVGGYLPYSVSYAKNGTNLGSISSPDGLVKISNLGLGKYTFTITDAEGCELFLDNPLDIEEVPTTITANGVQICEGETAELLATVPQNIPDPQFIWSFDAQGNNPITPGDVNGITYAVGPDGKLDITGLLGAGSPFTYYVTATGTGICGLSPKPVTVTMNPIANLKVSNPSVVCDPNGKVDLTDYIEGFNPAVYDYNVLSPSGAAMQLNEIESVALSGDYRVSSSVKGSNCWNQPQRIRVLIAETELIANFQYEIDLGGGILITNGEVQIDEDVQFKDLTQGKAILWNWDFGDGSTSSERNPVHQFLTKGTYTVILSTIDELGCQSEFQIIVNVFDDYLIMIPNAFTPTGNKNQYFKPQYRGIASMEFFIFNTWGELIYHTKSLEDQGWDGTLNGVVVPNGNYVYRGKFVSRSGEKIDKSGVFILIR